MTRFDDLHATAERLNSLEPSAEKYDGAVRTMHEAYAACRATKITEEQREQIMAVLNVATNLQQYLDRFEFSLACVTCDADSPPNYDEAIAAGWTGIEFDGTGYGWNFLGTCPDCPKDE
jgi:hypothetical protein